MKTQILSFRAIALLVGLFAVSGTFLQGQMTMKTGPGITERKMIKGETATLEIREYRGTLQWQHSDDGADWLEWSGKTGSQVEYVAEREVYVRVAVTSENCDPVYSSVAHIIPIELPTVTTSPITNISSTEAQSGGNINSDGGDPITARGVCWSTHHEPTTADDKTIDGTGIGVFKSEIASLNAHTPYFIRAYATNMAGTSYGNELSFTTLEPGSGYIGPQGGTVIAEDGAKVEIPAGALTDTVLISITDITESEQVSNTGCKVYDIQPEGLTFSDSVSLKLPFDPSYFDQNSPEPNFGIQIMRLNGEVWEAMPTTLDLGNNSAITKTKHFSKYVDFFRGYYADYFQMHKNDKIVKHEVPFYDQGDSNWCAFYSTSMLARHANYSYKAPTFATVGHQSVDEGLAAYQIPVYNSFLEGLGIQTEKIERPWTNVENLCGYLINKLDSGYPVWIWSGNLNHAFVVTGHDNIGFYVNDPADALLKAAEIDSRGTMILVPYDKFRKALTKSWHPLKAEYECTFFIKSHGNLIPTKVSINFALNQTDLVISRKLETTSIQVGKLDFGGDKYDNGCAIINMVSGESGFKLNDDVAIYVGMSNSDLSSKYTVNFECKIDGKIASSTSVELPPQVINISGMAKFKLTDLLKGNHWLRVEISDSNSGIVYDFWEFDFEINESAALPTVTTADITAITQTSATAGGNITSDGGATVTSRGVCWNTTGTPTVYNSKTTDGSGTGTFTSSLTGLTAGTTYYVRAYATNSVGPSYGEEKQFITTGGSLTFTDSRDGHVYKYVSIGSQDWMAENLAYLPSVSPSSTGSDTSPYYYVYGYEGSSVSAAKATPNYANYGVLYNSSATNGSCPSGWHLPSDEEWKSLERYLGMSESDANSDNLRSSGLVGGKLKESGTVHWLNPNVGANNSSGFTALPGGYRIHVGGFTSLTDGAFFWTSTEKDPSLLWYRYLSYGNDGVIRYGYNKGAGFSVRCLKGQGADFPIVTTDEISNISQNSADGGGNVTNDGGATVTARGVCWSTSQNPTTADSKTIDGSGTGSFTSSLTGLTASTIYFVRAYATNSVGTSYGEQKQFTTTGGGEGTFTDSRDSHVYKYVTIGNQTWMAENLAYLPSVSPSSLESNSSPYYYVYDYQGSNVSEALVKSNYSVYGVLYNWEAAKTACPTGWHLPSDAEWKTLELFLGMIQSEVDVIGTRYSGLVGKKLKSSSGWYNNGNGDNSSGFLALGGGYRHINLSFDALALYGSFWTFTEYDASDALGRMLSFLNDGVEKSIYFKTYGFSIRCLKD